jgi:hypothetical protein
MPNSATSLLCVLHLWGLLRGRFQSVQPFSPGSPACIRVYLHATAMHQGKVWNTKQFNQDKLRCIQQERVGQVYMGRVMTEDWDGNVCVFYKNKHAHCYTKLINKTMGA